MNSKRTAVLVSIIMVLLIGGVVGYAVMKANAGTDGPTPIPQSKLRPGGDAQTTTDTQTLGAADVGGISLQSNVGGATGGASGSGNSSSSPASGGGSVPGPESFSQFDKYKDAQAALFMDLVVGTGTEVAGGTKVAVTYQGWLTNGTLFDQSKVGDDGKMQAFTLTVGAHEVIPGWEQGLVGMKVGGKRRMIIPPGVGYGAKGQDPVPPNAVLVFDVVLHAAL